MAKSHNRIQRPGYQVVRWLIQNSSQLIKQAGWWLLGLSLGIYGLELYLTTQFLCQLAGPLVILASLVAGALSVIAMFSCAFRRKSVRIFIAALLVALIMTVLAFAGAGLTIQAALLSEPPNDSLKPTPLRG